MATFAARTARFARHGALILLLAGGGATVALAQSPTLMVDAARGSDAGDGSSAHPFKTVGRCATIAQAGARCLIHGGTYGEMLTPPHDGVIFEGVPNETAVITTADPVSGWTAQRGGVFTTAVALSHAIPVSHAGQSWPGDAVFDGGREIPQAQWPAASNDPLKPHWATIASVPTPDLRNGQATPEGVIADPALPAFSSPAQRATIHIWSGSGPFAEYEGAVTAAPGGRVAYIPLGAFESNFARPGGLYYVVGAPELLTADTWAYDAATQVLSWKPPPGVDPNQRAVRVKQRPATIDLSGRAGIVIRHLTLVGGGVVMDKASRHNRLEAITALHLSATQRPHALSPAVNGDLFNFGILLDGQDETLTDSTIAFTTQNGVTLHGAGARVDNVLIHDVDTFGDGAAGIYIGDRDSDVTEPRVTHTTIYRSGGADIAISANSRGDPTLRPSTVRNMELASNNLFGAMWLRTDGGAIYACCRNVTTGSRIHDNWIHANVAPANTHPPAGQAKLSPYAGVYWDNGMGGVDIRNNLVWESFPDIFIHGNSSADQPTQDVHIVGNTTADATSNCNLMLTAMVAAADVEAANNRVLFAPRLVNKAATGIHVVDNGPEEAGSAIAGRPGCSLAGCVAGEPAPVFPPGHAGPAPPVCDKPAPASAVR